VNFQWLDECNLIRKLVNKFDVGFDSEVSHILAGFVLTMVS